MHTPFFDYVRAWNNHDLVQVRALLPDFFDDRRRTGVGRLAADAYTVSLRALFELSPDVRIEPLYEAAVAPHGLVVASRWFGTNTEGGDIETVYVAVSHVERERIAGIELFEIEELEAALARFEELRPDPLRIPPNAATR